jgi:hypothetical protein
LTLVSVNHDLSDIDAEETANCRINDDTRRPHPKCSSAQKSGALGGALNFDECLSRTKSRQPQAGQICLSKRPEELVFHRKRGEELGLQKVLPDFIIIPGGW